MFAKRFALVFVLMLFFGIFSVASMPGPINLNNGISSKIISLLSSPGEISRTTFGVVGKDYPIINARAIAQRTGALAGGQICLSNGNLGDETWVESQDGSIIECRGNDRVELKATVLCDTGDKLLSDLQAANDSEMTVANFSHCGIDDYSSQVMCLVALSSDGLQVVSGQSLPYAPTPNQIIGILLLVAMLVAFVSPIFLTLFLLFKSDDKKVKKLFTLKTVLYTLPVLFAIYIFSGLSSRLIIPIQLIFLLILAQPLVYLVELLATFFAYWFSRQSKKNLKLVLMLLVLDIVALIFVALYIFLSLTTVIY